MMSRWLVFIALMMALTIHNQLLLAGAAMVGINYGTLGDNLPPPKDVINLIKTKNIQSVRLYDPNPDILAALRGQGIRVSVNIKNDEIQSFAENEQAAEEWIEQHILPNIFLDIIFSWIIVGLEVIPGPYAQYVLPALQNLQNRLEANGLGGVIFISTAVSTQVLGPSYPPSQTTFSPETSDYMIPIVKFLNSKGAPLMINVYPYFAYVSDPTHITLEFAQFSSQTPVFTDQGLPYSNLFDAMVDAFVAATEKALGTEDFNIVIGESGWPSAGGDSATIGNAQTYNQNLMNHALHETTPRKKEIPTFIFALFNEDQKPPGVEQNWGNFYPDLTPVYPLW